MLRTGATSINFESVIFSVIHDTLVSPPIKQEITARFILAQLKSSNLSLHRALKQNTGAMKILSQHRECAHCGYGFLNMWLECVQFINVKQVRDPQEGFHSLLNLPLYSFFFLPLPLPLLFLSAINKPTCLYLPSQIFTFPSLPINTPFSSVLPHYLFMLSWWSTFPISLPFPCFFASFQMFTFSSLLSCWQKSLPCLSLSTFCVFFNSQFGALFRTSFSPATFDHLQSQFIVFCFLY